MHKTGNYTITDLVELFRVSRPTVYRTLAAAEHVAARQLARIRQSTGTWCASPAGSGRDRLAHEVGAALPDHDRGGIVNLSQPNWPM